MKDSRGDVERKRKCRDSFLQIKSLPRAKIRAPRFHFSAYDGVGVGFGFFGVGDTGGRLIGEGLVRGFGVGVTAFLIGFAVGVGVERLIGNGDGVGLGVGVTIGGVGSNRCRVGDGVGVGVQSPLL